MPSAWTLFRFIFLRIVGKAVALTFRTMLSNILIEEASYSIRINDTKGERTTGKRVKRYRVRWHPINYFPEERVAAGPTGSVESLRVEHPSEERLEYIEGQPGSRICSFHVRAAGMRPTYLVRKVNTTDLVVVYEATDVYTDEDPPEPCTWITEIARDDSLPKLINFHLEFPKKRPMRTEPHVYHLYDLEREKKFRTDLSIEKSDRWKQISHHSRESRLRCNNSDLTWAKWSIRPRERDMAYKFEWDW